MQPRLLLLMLAGVLATAPVMAQTSIAKTGCAAAASCAGLAAAPSPTAHVSKRFMLDAARGHFPLEQRHATPVGIPFAIEPKLAPQSASAFAPSHAAPLPSGGAVAGFAQNSGSRTLVSLDLNTPGTLTAVGAANNQPFWGAGFLNGDTSKLYMMGDSGLYSVDTATGAPTLISGSAGDADVWGMTADPSSQKLYWIGPTSDQQLSTVDPVTGTTTLVGAITGAAAGNVINAIAADAQGHLYGIDRDTDTLVSIDKTNGNTAVIGSLGVNATNLSGLAFDPASGTLYFSNATIGVFTVNVSTGATTAVGTTQGNAQLVALAIGGGAAVVDEIFANGFEGVAQPDQPVQDPSFEASAGDSGANPDWTGVDDNSSGGTPFWTSASTTLADGAHTGDFVAWGGGWGEASSQHWLQSVTIPNGGPRYLNFWRKLDRLPVGGTATLVVSIDGTAVSTLDLLTASVDADWVNVSIDVSSYANGAAHVVRFDFAATGTDDGDVYVDDITIDSTAGSLRR